MFATRFHPHYSGAAKQALALARHLRDRGHWIEFVTVRWRGTAAYEVYEGFPVHRLEMGQGRLTREWRLWLHLLAFLWRRRGSFDVIHSHGAYYTNCIIGPLGRLFGLKSVIKASMASNDLHGIGMGFSGCLHRQCLRWVDVCIAISRDLEQEFRAAGLEGQQLKLLPNAVDTARFYPVDPPEKKALRIRLGLPAERPLALTVGCFNQRKNLGWLLRSWIRHKGFDTSARLLAIGPQSDEENEFQLFSAMQSLARDHSEWVEVRPETDCIEEYFRAADVFILPSSNEGMPNVILEAMASGLPCVATAVSGARDLVVEGQTGFIYPVDDMELFSGALARSLEAADTLGKQARKMVEANYSLSILASQYEQLYLSL